MKTQKAALALLDVQYSHIATRKSKATRDTQAAYYDGMRAMLETVLTDNFSWSGTIIRDENGKHHFVKR